MRFKVYGRSGVILAAITFVEDAALLLASRMNGATIRCARTGKILFTQGVDGDAGESYDRTAEICINRLED